MLRAYGTVLGVTMLIGVACASLAHGLMPGYWVLLPTLLAISCVVHEFAHGVVARYLAVRFVCLAKPGAAAIMYSRPHSTAARLIAFSGPAAAAAYCTAVAAAIGGGVGRYMCLTAAVIHLSSLLPFLADGKTLWRVYEK